MALVDKAGMERVRGELRSAYENLTVNRGLKPPHRLGIEVAFDSCPGRGRGLQRPGIDDLVRGLPDGGEIMGDGRMSSEAGIGLPDSHRLVQATTVDVGAGRSHKVVGEGVHLLVRL